MSMAMLKRLFKMAKMPMRKCKEGNCDIYKALAGLPGFAWDSCSIIMSIGAFHFYIIYFNFFSADHGIPQTSDENLTT